MRLDARHRTWLYLAALLGVAEPIAALDVYALFGNESAHTSLPTRWLAWGFAGVALLAALAWGLERRGSSRVAQRLALAVGLVALAGVADVLLLERYNVLMDYEIWVRQKGMPEKYAPAGPRPAPADRTPSGDFDEGEAAP